MKVLLHADGGAGVGLGHATRCSALSAALVRDGQSTRIAVTAASDLAGFLSRLGASTVESPADSGSIVERALAFGADAVVIDSYRWAASDFAHVRERGLPVVAFDDEGRRRLPVDAVVNGAPAATDLSYDVLPLTRRWLGPSFQIVRDAFRELPPREISRRVDRILVLVGGGDPLGLLPSLTECLARLAGATDAGPQVEVICGPYAAVPAVDRLPRVEVVQDPPDLPDRMVRADLAVSAGGQTLYELARCGTPTIAFCAGPDQAHNVQALAVAGAIVSIGDARSRGWLTRLTDAVQQLAGDEALRAALSCCARQVIDGRGADRVRDGILQLLDEPRRSASARVPLQRGRESPGPP